MAALSIYPSIYTHTPSIFYTLTIHPSAPSIFLPSLAFHPSILFIHPSRLSIHPSSYLLWLSIGLFYPSIHRSIHPPYLSILSSLHLSSLSICLLIHPSNYPLSFSTLLSTHLQPNQFICTALLTLL